MKIITFYPATVKLHDCLSNSLLENAGILLPSFAMDFTANFKAVLCPFLSDYVFDLRSSTKLFFFAAGFDWLGVVLFLTVGLCFGAINQASPPILSIFCGLVSVFRSLSIGCYFLSRILALEPSSAYVVCFEGADANCVCYRDIIRRRSDKVRLKYIHE